MLDVVLACSTHAFAHTHSHALSSVLPLRFLGLTYRPEAITIRPIRRRRTSLETLGMTCEVSQNHGAASASDVNRLPLFIDTSITLLPHPPWRWQSFAARLQRNHDAVTLWAYPDLKPLVEQLLIKIKTIQRVSIHSSIRTPSPRTRKRFALPTATTPTP